MGESNEFSELDDPEFLAERKRVREELAHASERAVSDELRARYEKLNVEFLRRARIAWTQAS